MFHYIILYYYILEIIFEIHTSFSYLYKYSADGL
jgi:hypothetical protein